MSETATIFQREKQRVSANEILQAIADGQDVDLFKCSISGMLDLNRLFNKEENFDTTNLLIRQKEHKQIVVLDQNIRFYNCTFEENVYFASPWSEQDFLDVVFKREAIFNSSEFLGQTRFSGAVFHSRAGFDGCIFKGVASFSDVVFKAPAQFRTVEFHGYALFNSAKFNKEARFVNTLFSKGGNFQATSFGGFSDFTGAYCDRRSVPIYEQVEFAGKSKGEDETFWRFVKQSAQNSGYYREAGECFYKERCSMLYRKFRGKDYDSLSRFQKSFRWLAGVRLLPELIFGKFLFGYGERPFRVLAAAFLIIIVCSALYSWQGALMDRNGYIVSKNSIMDMMYFSATTFTTVGFGDISPAPLNSFAKIVAMTEAMTGACLNALFVVCLAKRFSRN